MATEQDNNVNEAVKSGGSYEVIKKRLEDQGGELQTKAQKLNQLRQEEFGGSGNQVIGKVNIRTRNNCIPVDMAQVKGYLLFGYNVVKGMSQITTEDVFGLYNVYENEAGFAADEIPLGGSFLNDSKFQQDFRNLFDYYKGVELTQITRNQKHLLIAFKISSTDHRVFRFDITGNEVVYVDDRGDKELKSAISHDFEWIQTDRSHHVEGKFPHVSIDDRFFVETVGGDLTIKVENNTENGRGIYSEPVENKTQSLADADIHYAKIAGLYVLRIKPYSENTYRHFIFNPVNDEVKRIDSIGQSCKELPEDHGVYFPNGYYLTTGESRIFNSENEQQTYFQTIESPNGEDFLYIFYDIEEGFYTLYSYNLISKEFENPIHAHGYSIYNDGKVFIFRCSENNDASKIHPLRIWETSFCNDEHFEKQNSEKGGTFLSNIGNSELVRAISDIYSVNTLIRKDEVSTSIFETIIDTASNIINTYHWLSDERVGDFESVLKNVSKTAELIIDEFEKVKSIQIQSEKSLEDATQEQLKLVSTIKSTSSVVASDYVVLLSDTKKHLGHLISLKDARYIDVDAIDELIAEIEEHKDEINLKLVNLLQQEGSFDTYLNRIDELAAQLEKAEKTVEIEPVEEEAQQITDEVNLINDEVNEIEVKDPLITSQILDSVSEVFSKLNKTKAQIKNKKKSFMSEEAKTEFSSQFKLLSQSVSSALTNADTPDKCDEQMARLMTQIESLESKFSEFDEFLTEIYTKREEVLDIFETHKQQLLSELQKRIGNIEKAAKITLDSVAKKAEKFDDIDDLNSYFASDNMVMKIGKFIKDIADLGDSVKSEDITAQLKKIKDKSLRALRDNNDIFEDNGNIMKMGKHKFSVNKNEVDLTIIPRDDKMALHLTATDFYQDIDNEEFNRLNEYRNMDTVSESDVIYKGEYLAYSVLRAAERNEEGLTFDNLIQASHGEEGQLLSIIQKYSATRYKEGYIKGVHDSDAEIILREILNIKQKAGLLSYGQKERATALLYRIENDLNWASLGKQYKEAKVMANILSNASKLDSIISEYADLIEGTVEKLHDGEYSFNSNKAAEYLLELISSSHDDSAIDFTKDSKDLADEVKFFLKEHKIETNLTASKAYFEFLYWVEAYANHSEKTHYKSFINEAAMILALQDGNDIRIKTSDVALTLSFSGLIGDHRKIDGGEYTISFDEFMENCSHHEEVIIPNFERFNELKHQIAEEQREKLQISDFKANPLSSFVRNRLITESYFHMIGDNFAKQIGTAGDSKRSDLMGMLLLISPPGYGKTTIIEYIAAKLGLVFMKINCPSLGHNVTSLDPSEAPDATSRKEVEKLNLALEMGNNVLLYLDDIQHTNSEFLQRFISLCDGTRRIEGVWNGKPKTYDMKGKKFAVVMAGNPYTETGDTFHIPDMLANRADTYNLGDMLSGQQEVFELSYIENSLTSNSVLAPLATRNMQDLYKFIDMAKGHDIPLNELEHNYSPAEANEIVGVIKKMLVAQDVVLKVNQQYIKSAATADKYRTEPAFKLQGSYRNMNKLAEKIVSAMNDEELHTLVLDHYIGESQTLSEGSEENMLKLKELLGILTEEESARWEAIKSDFRRHKMMGDEGTDGTAKIANQLASMNELMQKNSGNDSVTPAMLETLQEIVKKVGAKDPELEKLLREKDVKSMEFMDKFTDYLDLAMQARKKRNNEKKDANSGE